MLPFIAGVAAGAAVVVAINNKKKIKKAVSEGAKKVQDYAEKGYEKSKEFAGEVKATVSEKVECIKSKGKEKENSKNENDVKDKDAK